MKIKSPWLAWAIVFLIVGIVASVLDLGAIAGLSISIGKLALLVFVILIIIHAIKAK
jgi:uncharacterized membrane protein YtjA (UPF0391 family)